MNSQQNCGAILHLNYRKGGLAPYGKIGYANFSYPRLACEIRLDTAFRSCAAMGTYLSTHAIASQAQSHRLKPNLTRLDRSSLTLASEVLEKGLCPFRRLASPISPIPVGRETRRLRGISPALSMGFRPSSFPYLGFCVRGGLFVLLRKFSVSLFGGFRGVRGGVRLFLIILSTLFLPDDITTAEF